MSLEFKAGVDFNGLTPELVAGIWVAERIFQRFSLPCVVTSCRDGVHKEGSLHGLGDAADLRSKHVPRDRLSSLELVLRRELTPLGFDVLLEHRDDPREHFHIERDRKKWPTPPGG